MVDILIIILNNFPFQALANSEILVLIQEIYMKILILIPTQTSILQ